MASAFEGGPLARSIARRRASGTGTRAWDARMQQTIAGQSARRWSYAPLIMQWKDLAQRREREWQVWEMSTRYGQALGLEAERQQHALDRIEASGEQQRQAEELRSELRAIENIIPQSERDLFAKAYPDLGYVPQTRQGMARAMDLARVMEQAEDEKAEKQALATMKSALKSDEALADYHDLIDSAETLGDLRFVTGHIDKREADRIQAETNERMQKGLALAERREQRRELRAEYDHFSATWSASDDQEMRDLGRELRKVSPVAYTNLRMMGMDPEEIAGNPALAEQTSLSKPPEGQIWVISKATQRMGLIPEDKFDPERFERL